MLGIVIIVVLALIGIFGVLFPSDWEVCGTSPAADSTVRPGSTVSLAIDRPGAC